MKRPNKLTTCLCITGHQSVRSDLVHKGSYLCPQRYYINLKIFSHAFCSCNYVLTIYISPQLTRCVKYNLCTKHIWKQLRHEEPGASDVDNDSKRPAARCKRDGAFS